MPVFDVRTHLKSATAAWHDRVEAAFGRADLGTRSGYAAFLRAQAAAHLPVEAALEAAGVRGVLPDWDRRTRAAALRADLTELGVAAPPLLAAPAIAGTAQILGSVYVLEGSRLGGAMLKRGVPAELPQRFLGSVDSKLWRDLLALLDIHLPDPEDRDDAVAAAIAVFRTFEHAGTAYLKADDLEGSI
ncbi:biliverdin-producing heme oxygenase [Sphingomonas donggukensis]|uniref:Biliverdin-producing heme oxygenase n=1 Tax=Sphingomonas donggukensis TaxID=2949093 RepID=A0ABY4TVI3_9SPHN|nr:biliverdin-producing heme oxygenase [Sphingomonas donggukensis]URW76403.1 biliverdin-producing heme oxygenase [Sphingomonas donggukensis]